MYVLEVFERKQNRDEELAPIKKYEEDFGLSFVDLKKSHEEDLAMRKLVEEILFEAACNGIFLSMDWIQIHNRDGD